jgi:hypothetical protein
MTTSLPVCCHLLHLGKKTKRWWWAKEACSHLLHLRKKIKMMTSQGGSLSSATPEKKKKRWRRTSWLVVIFYTWKKMMMSQEVCHHLLHLRKKPRDLFSPYIFQLLIQCAQHLSVHWFPCGTFYFHTTKVK